ncbi:MAG: hypothetical protein IPM29_10340 [Planctomycetes bacterium]|nr:hypothetical protein [Planctomycetota bacterium]
MILPEVEPTPVWNGIASFACGGAAAGFGTEEPLPGQDEEVIRYAHWWGGGEDTYPNLVQGAWMYPTEVVDSWYSAIGSGEVAAYGQGAQDCKDLRNNASLEYGSALSAQSLRIGEDQSGPVVVLNTPGASIKLLRPPPMRDDGSTPGDHMGEILWQGSKPLSGPQIDDGFGGMALVVRQNPAEPLHIDVFAGACLSYPSPGALPPTATAGIWGSVRWLQWDAAAMHTQGAAVILEPDSTGRGGFGVCGLAVGDLIEDASCPGDELVVTTLAGDLYVFALDASSIGAPLVHTWVPGSLGAYNAIIIEDLDQDGHSELYVAGSQGIWKWKQQ